MQHPDLMTNMFSHREGKGNIYILIGHLPVGSLSIGHYFPHHNPIAPDITGRGKFAEGYSFRSCPSDWDFPSLEIIFIYIYYLN